MIYSAIFVIGLFFGSFLNLIVDRLYSKETILKGRSHCEFCKKNLEWFDLIPLLSFIILKGKCRYCHKKLSFYYPLVEVTTGILYVVSFLFVFGLNFQFTGINIQLLNFFYFLFLSSSFIIIFFEDLKHGLIPEMVVYPTILVSFVYLILNSQPISNYLLSGFGAFSFFLLLFLITKGKGMGFGDVILAFLLGLVLGFPKIILALYIAFLTGAIFGLILILWKKKRSLKETIPFGPFLIAGTLISLFLGYSIIPRVMLLLGF